MKLIKTLQKLAHNQRGATAVEYGLIASLIVIAVIGAITAVGDETNGYWNRVSSTTSEAMGTVR